MKKILGMFLKKHLIAEIKIFLKKLKLAHSSLTPNDLRLFAYLRLNLSSKEILPLLYITVRSIENKRYHLRKKLI